MRCDRPALVAVVTQWRGWKLDGVYLVEPRRVRLAPSEARILKALLEHRLHERKLGQAHKIKQTGHMTPDDLKLLSGSPTLVTMRSNIATLRSAIGKNALVMTRGVGYKLEPADDRNGITIDPIDDLVNKLTDALDAARRVQASRKEGLI